MVGTYGILLWLFRIWKQILIYKRFLIFSRFSHNLKKLFILQKKKKLLNILQKICVQKN